MTPSNSHHATTELEFAMPVDTDIVTDQTHLESADSVDVDTRLDPSEDVTSADRAESTVEVEPSPTRMPRVRWQRIVAYGVLPGLALLLAVGAGYLKWQDNSARQAQTASAQAIHAATESTIAVLSYQPDTADKDLTAARDRLTGAFRDDYTKLINDIVIPGAKQKHISALANIPAAATVSTTENHAVVLVFVNQTVTVGDGVPTNTASSVRITLDKVQDRWLISQFDPV